ncbi:MAG: hypothetical protein QM764_22290 [Chitinophagaceae bacterium]
MKTLLLTATCSLFCIISFCQTKKSTVREHLQQVRTLYGGDLEDGPYVTQYIMDSIIQSVQSKISGTLIKDGKTVATTATVDDKSVTVNYNIGHFIDERLFVQATVSGTAADNFVDIFSGGKYKKTITGGFNFNFFPKWNSGSFYSSYRQRLWTLLKIQDHCFDRSKRKNAYKSTIEKLVQLYNDCRTLYYADPLVDNPQLPAANDIDCKKCSIEKLQEFNQLLSSLSDYYPKKFNSLGRNAVGHFLDSIATLSDVISGELADKDNLTVMDSLQHAAKWSAFGNTWWSGSIKFNQKTQPLFNPSLVDKNYTDNYNDYFVTLSLSYNYMKTLVDRGITVYFAPTISFGNARNFIADSLLSLQAQENFPVSATDSLKVINATSFYRAKAGRLAQFGVELPLIVYFPSASTGIDIAAGMKFSNHIDSVYARFGIYIPISTGKDDVVTVEPLLRFSNLNKSGQVFFKDILSFGFNVSVSIPKFVSGK